MNGRPAGDPLLKLAEMIGRDEAFLAIGRHAASKRARGDTDAEPVGRRAGADVPPDAGDDHASMALHRHSPLPSLTPTLAEDDERRSRHDPSKRSPRLSTSGPSAPTRQLGHALSELARLIGRIDSLLARGAHGVPSSGGDDETDPAGRARLAARRRGHNVAVRSGHAQPTETDNSGLSPYIPSRKRRITDRVAAGAHAWGGAPSGAEEPSGGREQADYDGDNYYTRPPPQHQSAVWAPPWWQRRKIVTTAALLALMVAAAAYGYWGWIAPGRPGAIAVEAATVSAAADADERPSVDAPAEASARRPVRVVLPYNKGLMTPATTLNGGGSASAPPAGKSTLAGIAMQAARPHEADHVMHRPPGGRAPIGASARNIPMDGTLLPTPTNLASPCSVAPMRGGC
jgi:hypothetical protein